MSTGKYASVVAEILYGMTLDGQHKEETGDSCEYRRWTGYFDLADNPMYVVHADGWGFDTITYAIVQEDNFGFVSCETGTKEEMRQRFEEEDKAYTEWLGEEEW